jgi:hypothetical protein
LGKRKPGAAVVQPRSSNESKHAELGGDHPRQAAGKQARHWETWVSIGSAVVALAALLLSVVQAYSSRTHDRLSLMPHLEFLAGTGRGDSAFIAVTNNGLGPARIVGIEFQFQERFFRVAGELDYPSMFASLRIPIDSVAALGDVYYTAPSINSYLGPGQTITLITLRSPRDSAAASRFASLAQLLDPLICYASVYGDRFYSSPHSAVSNPGSCRFDGTVRLLGARRRFYNPIDPPLSTEQTHGIPP